MVEIVEKISTMKSESKVVNKEVEQMKQRLETILSEGQQTEKITREEELMIQEKLPNLQSIAGVEERVRQLRRKCAKTEDSQTATR